MGRDDRPAPFPFETDRALIERAFDPVVGSAPAGSDAGGEIGVSPAPRLAGFDSHLEKIGDTGLVSAEHAKLARLPGICRPVGRFPRRPASRGIPCSGFGNRENNREFGLFTRPRGPVRYRIMS
ncbi:MAG: hypothetical protein P0Y59_08585 [Candidatus Sphingomonas phytovorans]|nr:hypothetical protein [Sphingomonas sp.]WEK01713.1 MAG: hypothetical protein P0Y59_08585 [Sphingomonas sp.]